MPIFEHAGLRLAYDDTGRPDRPPMVLLHGWCSARQDLAPLARAFQTSHRVINLDLAGHGDSEVPADEDRLSAAAQAGSVLALCDALDVREAVLVGHSGGAAVAAEAAATRPGLAAALVALDGALIFPAELAEQSTPLVAALRTPAWQEAIAGLITASFLPTDDPALARRASDRAAKMAQHVVAGYAEQMLRWDAEAALGAIGAAGTPFLYVEAAGLCDLDRLRSLVPQLQLARVAGIGHDQMLETPRQSVAIIEGFLAASIGRRPVDNGAPIRALFEAVSSGNLDAIDRLVSADFVDHGAPPPYGRGPEGYKQVFRLLRGALHMTWENLDIAVDGERVALRVRTTGRHVGEFFGIPPTGRDFTVETMHFYRVEGGVIREHWAVRDDLAMFRQLGLVAA